MSKKRDFSPGNVTLWVFLIAMAVVQMFPLVWLLDFSVASSNEMFTSGLLIKPEVIRWENYKAAFIDGHFLQYFKNSLIINVLAVLLVLILSVMLAYACTRMRWRLSGLVRGLIMMGLMIPIHATLLPNFIIYDRLHLTDTIWALLIPYVAFSLPQGMYSSNYAVQFAVMALTAMPMVIIYVILNKQITKGVAAGAVKG